MMVMAAALQSRGHRSSMHTQVHHPVAAVMEILQGLGEVGVAAVRVVEEARPKGGDLKRN